jgi:hypothetical protein
MINANKSHEQNKSTQLKHKKEEKKSLAQKAYDTERNNSESGDDILRVFSELHAGPRYRF